MYCILLHMNSIWFHFIKNKLIKCDKKAEYKYNNKINCINYTNQNGIWYIKLHNKLNIIFNSTQSQLIYKNDKQTCKSNVFLLLNVNDYTEQQFRIELFFCCLGFGA